MGMSLLKQQMELCTNEIDIEFVDKAVVVTDAEQSIKIRVVRNNSNLLERFKIYFESVSDVGIEVGAWTHSITLFPGDDCIELSWPLYIAPSTKSGIYEFNFVLESSSGQTRLAKHLFLLQRRLQQGSLSRRARQARLFAMMDFLAELKSDPIHH